MATIKVPIGTNNWDVDTYRNKLENQIRIQNLQVTCFPSGEWTVLSWVTISSSVEASYLAPTPRIFCWLWVSKDPVDNSPDLVEADRTLEGNLQEKCNLIIWCSGILVLLPRPVKSCSIFVSTSLIIVCIHKSFLLSMLIFVRFLTHHHIDEISLNSELTLKSIRPKPSFTVQVVYMCSNLL